MGLFFIQSPLAGHFVQRLSPFPLLEFRGLIISKPLYSIPLCLTHAQGFCVGFLFTE